MISDALKHPPTFFRRMRIHPIDQHENSFDSCCFGKKKLFVEDPQACRSCIVEKVSPFVKSFLLLFPCIFFFPFLFWIVLKDGVILLQIELFIGRNDKESNI